MTIFGGALTAQEIMALALRKYDIVSLGDCIIDAIDDKNREKNENKRKIANDKLKEKLEEKIEYENNKFVFYLKDDDKLILIPYVYPFSYENFKFDKNSDCHVYHLDDKQKDSNYWKENKMDDKKMISSGYGFLLSKNLAEMITNILDQEPIFVGPFNEAKEKFGIKDYIIPLEKIFEKPNFSLRIDEENQIKTDETTEYYGQ